MRPMSAGVWGLIVLLSMIWGGSFFLTEIGLTGMGPLTLVTGRVGIAAVALWVIIVARGDDLPRFGWIWLSLFVMGAMNNVLPFSLISWGQTRIDSGVASILNATTPLFAVLVAHVFTKDEKLTVNRFGGVLCGVAGVAVLIGPNAIAGLADFGDGALLGQCAGLTASLCYAFAGIFGRRLRGLSPMVAAAGMLTGSTIMMVPMALIVEKPHLDAFPGPAPLAAVAAMALICTAFAYLLYFRILALAGATNLLLVTLLVPVGAMFLGSTFLGEQITLNALAGVGLIGLGLLAVDGRVFLLFYKPSTSSGG